MRLLLVILTFLVSFIGYSQTYNYTYTDPCNGTLQTVTVPINGEVTVGYYGFVETFSYNDFTSGVFESWAQSVFDQFGGNSPCSEIVGVGTVVNVTQGTAFNVIGILNSLGAISDIAGVAGGATNMLGGSMTSVSNASNGESSQGEESSNENKSNGTNNSNEGGSTNSGSTETNSNGGNGTSNTTSGNESSTQAGGTSVEGGSNENGNSEANPPVTNTNENGTNTGNNTSGNSGSTGSSGNSGGTSSGSQTEEGTPTTEGQTEEKGKSNVTGGATTTTKNAPSKSEGGKPTVVASSDFVGFNFRNSEVKTGLKATGGYTALRWDGQRSWGALVDYTSALKGPNATGFYAWIKPKSVALLSTTLTVGFVGNKSLYGTLAGGQMFSFTKVPRLKAVYMGTVSYGVIQKEQFLGTAAIAGVMYDFKIGKKIDIKLMDLLVYVPYVSYYNDLVLQSPWVMLPSIGTNIGITKRFKFNINAGGAWDLKTSALNYTITCGTRMLVGQ